MCLAAAAAQAGLSNVSREQNRAMGLARAGDTQRALRLLESILRRYPHRYSAQRDYILVATWAKDCRRILAQFEKLTPRQQLYPRLAVPAARCIRADNRVRTAIALLEKARRRYPKSAIVRAELGEANDELGNQKATLETGIETETSAPGAREIHFDSTIYGEVADHLEASGRLLVIRSHDPQAATADMNRVFGSLEYIFGKSSIVAELSTDLARPGESGVGAILHHHPNDLWALEAGYYTFSEDIPLRALALNITSDQWHFGVDHHSKDHRWEWTAAADAYRFSDTNWRREWYSVLGYGFDIRKESEQRAIFEASQSYNTLASTVYYNPLSDTTLDVGYRYTWRVKSRYKRHANQVHVWVGTYSQENHGTNGIYGIRYQQDYDFGDASSLDWNVSWESRVYDGGRESGFNAGIHYKRNL